VCSNSLLFYTNILSNAVYRVSVKSDRMIAEADIYGKCHVTYWMLVKQATG
jgi:hypothetical protein